MGTPEKTAISLTLKFQKTLISEFLGASLHI
jgi:hypothetical protein